MLQEFINQINVYLTLILAYGFSVTIAGAAKAWVAKKMGDPTGEYGGYLTLDPLVHVDLLGMIVLLFTGFGWGRNVPVSVENIRSPRRTLKLLTVFYSSAVIHILLCVATILLSVLLSYAFGQGYFTATFFGKILINILKSLVNISLFLAMLRFIQASMDLIFLHAIELHPENSIYIELGSLIGALFLMRNLGMQIVEFFHKIAFGVSGLIIFLFTFLSSVIYKLFSWM